MIIAGNIGQLRRNAGLTQAELAQKLNYSDKAISKWERGESVPDVGTLKAVADCFSVSVDYLLRAEHPVETEFKREFTKRQRRNHKLITAMSCVLVWLLAVAVYTSVDVVLPSTRMSSWMVYIFAVPITLVVLLVLNSIWGKPTGEFFNHFFATVVGINLCIFSLNSLLQLLFLVSLYLRSAGADHRRFVVWAPI